MYVFYECELFKFCLTYLLIVYLIESLLIASIQDEAIVICKCLTNSNSDKFSINFTYTFHSNIVIMLAAVSTKAIMAAKLE